MSMTTNKQTLRIDLLIENGQLVADTLRHLSDNEIESDYFAITSTCEAYGTEVDHELVITDYARQAAGTVDELVKALEAAERRNAELEMRFTALLKPTMSQLIAGKRQITTTGKMSRLMLQRLADIYRAMIGAAATDKGE